MRFKKLGIYLISVLLMISLVFAQANVNSTETNSIEKNSAVANVVTNETVNGTLFLSKNSDLSNVERTIFNAGLGADLDYALTGLDIQTTYFWQVNGSNVNGFYTTTTQTFDTVNRTLSGIEFVLYALLTLIFVAIVFIFVFLGLRKNATAMELVNAIIMGSILSLILVNIIRGLLAS